MNRRKLAMVWLLAGAAWLAPQARANTYYVDATGGSDGSTGLTTGQAWKTVAKVNGAALAAGDLVLFKRGETWRESLNPAASGAAGNPIKFDAYGSGEAPTLSAALPLGAGAWSVDSGYVWKAAVTGTSMNFVLLGTIWGNKQTAKANVTANRDWYFASNTLYVYAQGNPSSYYGDIEAITLAGTPLIYVNGRSYLEFQHFRLTYFDTYGARVAGAADHLTFANLYVDGQVPNGTLPHGFYVSATPSPGDINFYNDDAHRNYNGFRFDGGATLIRVKNCRGYANRNKGLEDNTGGAHYSYSHFYANNLAIMNSQDMTGGVNDGNNIAADTWPGVTGFARYPARVSFTVDDVGLVTGADGFVDSLLPEFTARGLKMSIGFTTGYALSTSLIPKVLEWIGSGHDINSHSWSHQYYTSPNAFTLRYTGAGTAATASLAGNRLTTAITGGPGGENLDLDLNNATYDTVSELVATINGRGVYAATQDAGAQGAAHSFTLADVTTQNIKSTYTLQFQKDRLMPDELGASRNWLQTNVAGLTNVKVYVYPDGIEDTATQGWAAAAGYEGARGALAMGLGSKEVYGAGVNLQNITSFGTSGMRGMTAAQIEAKMAALVFKASVWGVPYGLFCHNAELTAAEVGYILDGLVGRGALVITNSQMADAVHGMAAIGTGTYYVASAGGEVDFRPTGTSPVLNAGAGLGTSYALDLEGMDQGVFGAGWEMGTWAVVQGSPLVVVVGE